MNKRGILSDYLRQEKISEKQYSRKAIFVGNMDILLTLVIPTVK